MNYEARRIASNDAAIAEHIRTILVKARADVARAARGLITEWPVPGWDADATDEMLNDLTPTPEHIAAIEAAAIERAAELALDEEAGRPWEPMPVLIAPGIERRFA